jgi:hypothetical protein
MFNRVLIASESAERGLHSCKTVSARAERGLHPCETVSLRFLFMYNNNVIIQISYLWYFVRFFQILPQQLPLR